MAVDERNDVALFVSEVFVPSNPELFERGDAAGRIVQFAPKRPVDERHRSRISPAPANIG